MSVLPEKSMGIVLAVAGALFILVAVIAASGGANLLEIPSTDFFGFLGSMFEFFEQKIGLAGEGTRDFFCAKDVKEAMELCSITSGELREYCDARDEEKIGICQIPDKSTKGFCDEPWSTREKTCKNMNEFNSACDAINAIGSGVLIKDLPFCK